MEVDQAEDRLRQLLAESGFDFDKSDPILGWQVFKRFAQEPVQNADDEILFQIGVYDFTGSEQCNFEFVRQFSLDDEKGDWDHFEQLRMVLLCVPNEQLRQIETNRWAFDFPSLEMFFAEVESMDAFQVVLAQKNWRCKILQNEV